MLKTEEYEDLTLITTGRGIFGIFLYPVYSYLLDDLLIDTGTTKSETELLHFLRDKELHTIVNTHAHEDHIGNNAILKETKEVRIYAHPEAIKLIEDPHLLDLRRYQKFTWGLPSSSHPMEIPSEIRTHSHTLEVIHTPGHSPGHICLYDPKKKWLFSGDLHVGKFSLEAQPFDDLVQIITSLKKLATYDISEIFCGHQGRFSRGNEVLKKKLTFLEEAKRQAEQLYEDNVSLKQITRRVAGKEGVMKLITGGHMSKMNGIKSLLQLD
ncbi:MAG: MBL fold metallo-hydrolase [Promethearchaeia archaeon]